MHVLYDIIATNHGRGLFARNTIPPGVVLCEMVGPRVNATRFTQPDYDPTNDHYIQIGVDSYIGPSDGPDDLINHSCDPNAYISFEADGRILVRARRLIAAFEEIAFDYSTTMLDDDWEMRCQCGSASCRGTVREFATLPVPLHTAYVQEGIVAPYIAVRYDGLV